MTESEKKTKLNAWLRLIRVPNLFTAAGDPLCGFLIAGGLAHLGESLAHLFTVCWISFFVYIFGLITNDMADIQEDMQGRPNRPLPSGAISGKEAFAAVQICFWAAVIPSLINIRLFCLTLILFACVYAYNFHVKRKKYGGSAIMAMCRVLSFCLGITAVRDIGFFSGMTALIFGVGIFLYIFGLTEAAADETSHTASRKGGRALLTGALLCSGVVLIDSIILFGKHDVVFHNFSALSAILLLVFFLGTAFWGYQLTLYHSAPAKIQHAIGVLIRAILLMHAAVAASFGWYLLAAVFVICMICATFFSRVFRIQGS